MDGVNPPTVIPKHAVEICMDSLHTCLLLQVLCVLDGHDVQPQTHSAHQKYCYRPSDKNF
jgi:hypothetical protein